MKTKILFGISVALFLGGVVAFELSVFLNSPSLLIISLYSVVIGGSGGILAAFCTLLELQLWKKFGVEPWELLEILADAAERIEAFDGLAKSVKRLITVSNLSTKAKADVILLRGLREENRFTTREEAIAWLGNKNPDMSWDPRALDLVFGEEAEK